MSSLVVYFGLFLTAFIAATILPAQSEAALAALLLGTDRSWVLLIAVASLGNILGSTTNWVLGRYIVTYRDRRWFPATPAQIERASGWYRRFGKYSLLLSWVPVIGDPLTLVAGVLREPLPIFLLLVSIAKIGRYCIVAAIAAGFL